MSEPVPEPPKKKTRKIVIEIETPECENIKNVEFLLVQALNRLSDMIAGNANFELKPKIKTTHQNADGVVSTIELTS